MTTKTILINDNDFKIIPTKKTKKNKEIKETKNKKPILMKNNTINKLRHFIKKKQELIEKKDNMIHPPSITNNTPLNGEFNESLNFFNKIKENINSSTIVQPTNTHNYTLKHNQEQFNTQTPIFPNGIIEENTFDINKTLPPIHLEQPKYGVLKNGKLPTYREYMKMKLIETKKTTLPPPTNIAPITTQIPLNKNIQQNFSTTTIIEQKAPPIINNIKYKKQKTTIRRTFHVGRIKRDLKIGVIINNKTMRNECSTKKHLLKQTPINEVKQFLLKRGLIKIGTSAPNDILRKIYESANFICGEVQNHNNEILLHNYFNDNDAK